MRRGYRLLLLLGMLTFAGCAKSNAAATPDASLDKALSSQEALLGYFERVNLYDVPGALA